MILSSKQQAIQIAREIMEKKPIYLDTETTGIGQTDEIVEITILDADGKTLFETLVKPSKPIPIDVIQIHGISNEMVTREKPWPFFWPTIRGFLINQVIATYNADFDHRMLNQSHIRYSIDVRDPLHFFCIMKLYAQFRGQWNEKHGSYRYHKLEDAAIVSGIHLPNIHRSHDDALLARELLIFMANSKN